MTSQIPGFEYDIFISYRQKDNKYDGWVTDFVGNLKKELEATFKDEISVYFDINPHNGLLETHDVNASLKEKLKCLIFIPIISRTYCDPKSFAWEHEFKAFVEQASKDQFGLRVKLRNGNVAGRVLPIRIHDLDAEDLKLCESAIEGVLRGIEFIYKEPGVNKPLTADDDEKRNLNNTKYRLQINKVALAIKEIISGLKSEPGSQDLIKTKTIGSGSQRDSESRTKEYPGPSIFRTKSKKWLIMLLSALMIIFCAFSLYKIIEKGRQAEDISKIEKSIAVLPFVNDSPDQINTYFINGIMEEILNNLQKIKDFRVISRTSVEQFRNTSRPTLPEIAKKLDVNYIVEGSGQKYGNKFVLRVQLLAANNERHLWGESYEQEIKETSDIIGIQSQVAQSIASELKATITPEEKQLIEKNPTANLTAYDYYHRGEEEIRKYGETGKIQMEKRAEEMYNKALELDSSFAMAYIGLAMIYYSRNYYKSYLSENWLDSVLIMTDRALSFDDQLDMAYFVRGVYYLDRGKSEQAVKEFEKALQYNPNFLEVFATAGWSVYFQTYNVIDYVKGLQYLEKAVRLNRGKELPELLRDLGNGYSFAGFPVKKQYYVEEAFKLDGDTTKYLQSLAAGEWMTGNFEKSMQMFTKCYRRDSNNISLTWQLANACIIEGKDKEAFEYYKKLENNLEYTHFLHFSSLKWLGYVYWQNGYKKEAEEWFNKQKKLSEASLKIERMYSVDANIDLACVYAFTGEREKAYENLKAIGKIRVCPLWALNTIKYDPLLRDIRNEPEFQKIISQLESKFQAEHERVRKWLEEQGKL